MWWSEGDMVRWTSKMFVGKFQVEGKTKLRHVVKEYCMRVNRVELCTVTYDSPALIGTLFRLSVSKRKKVKLNMGQAMKAQDGCRGVAVLFL